MDKIIYDENEDWGKRSLCSDESCIGTIGTDGKCKECGKVYEGKLPAGGSTKSVQKTKIEKQTTVSSEEAESDDDWEKRVLCVDEACIGVIGDDGKCKECGKLNSK
jgi:hypothetical protein